MSIVISIANRLLSYGMLLIVSLSCQRSSRPSLVSDTLVSIRERDLIPEGTAFDPRSKQVFISSLFKRKVVAIKEDGQYFDFVGEAQNEIGSTLGMEVDTLTNQLWVVSCYGKPGIPTRMKLENDRWYGQLYSYRLPSGDFNGTYSISPEIQDDFCFNDLAVSLDGDVYLSESINNKIYVLKKGEQTILEFMKPTGATFLNGIAFSPDNNFLFVTCSEGVLRIDMSTHDYSLIAYEFTAKPGPIDGLNVYRQSLIGHQGTVLTRFYLNEKMDSITYHEYLDEGLSKISTTGVLGLNGMYYYIANSQIRSGIDYSKMEIKPMDSLEDIVIKRKAINDSKLLKD